MREYLPILILGAIIGTFTLFFLVIYALEKNKKETMGFERNMSDKEIVKRLLRYAIPYKKNFVIVFFVMLFSSGHTSGAYSVTVITLSLFKSGLLLIFLR